MREELLADVLDDVSLAEQMADNPRVKKLLNCYNLEAAKSGQHVIIEITQLGKALKEALLLLEPRTQLRILSKYHDTIGDVEVLERDSQRFKLIEKVVTWLLGMGSIIVVGSIGLLFLSTFYDKPITGLDYLKNFLEIIFELIKFAIPL